AFEIEPAIEAQPVAHGYARDGAQRVGQRFEIDVGRRVADAGCELKGNVVAGGQRGLHGGAAGKAMQPATDGTMVKGVDVDGRRRVRIGIANQEVKGVVGPEHEQLDVVARAGAPMEVELIVPVDRLELKVAGGEEGQERVDPAPPGADGQREIL